MRFIFQGRFYSVVKVYMISSINFPCKVCGKDVNANDQTIQCDLYSYWIHVNCNNLNYIDYKFLQNSNDPGHSFNSMKSNKKVFMCVSNFHNNSKPVKTLNSERSLLLKPSENFRTFRESVQQ